MILHEIMHITKILDDIDDFEDLTGLFIWIAYSIKN